MSCTRILSVVALCVAVALAVGSPCPSHAQTESGVRTRNSLSPIIRRRRSAASSAISSISNNRRRRSGGGDDEDEEIDDTEETEDVEEVEELEDTVEGAINEAIDEVEENVSCFPPEATIELRNGARVRMDMLSIGDIVRVAPGNGDDSFSSVFMFTHKDPLTLAKRITLRTVSGTSVSSTRGHYMYADGALVPAKDINVGAKLTLASGDQDEVVEILETEGQGVYNPQTISGDIVVDGVLASTYTTAFEPSMAHALLAPFRVLSSLGFQLNVLESGAGPFRNFLPRGSGTLV